MPRIELFPCAECNTDVIHLRWGLSAERTLAKWNGTNDISPPWNPGRTDCNLADLYGDNAEIALTTCVSNWLDRQVQELHNTCTCKGHVADSEEL